MTKRELKLLLNANALKHSRHGIVADGNPLGTSKRETREFKTLDTAAKFLFKMGVADFAVRLKTTG